MFVNRMNYTLYHPEFPSEKETLYFEGKQVLPLKEENKKHQGLLYFNVLIPK